MSTSIHPLESILGGTTFGCNYNCRSSGMCLKLDPDSFCSFFLAKLVKLCQIGWKPWINNNFGTVLQQILSWTKVWAWSNTCILGFEPLQCCFGRTLRVVVLLQAEPFFLVLHSIYPWPAFQFLLMKHIPTTLCYHHHALLWWWCSQSNEQYCVATKWTRNSDFSLIREIFNPGFGLFCHFMVNNGF